MKNTIVVALLLLAQFTESSVLAGSSADIDAATTYAAIIGRAIACGVNTDTEVKRVSTWLDSRFVGKERSTQIAIFAAGMESNAKMQASGKSPDTCDAVKRQYRLVNWP